MNGIADTIGFSNVRTFRNAFLHHYGVTPGTLRKN
ncbi:MAG TPA: hypothetical protein EYQ00_04455 [Dehalococcoidia bacterium]|nr:hypothetical protein [Dehalococcoidia bacterium]